MPTDLPAGLARMKRELERLAASPQSDDPAVARRLALMAGRGAQREQEYLASAGRGRETDLDAEDGDIHSSVYGPQ